MNQIDKKKIVVAVLLVILLGWRFIPRSFSDVISVDTSKVINYACSVNICGIDDNAMPFVQPYDLETVKKGDENFEDVFSVLDKTGYRPDFRNLLPWAITKVESDDDLNEMNAIVVLVWGNEPNDNCIVHFLEDDKVSVSLGKRDGYLIYHPTNSETLKELVEYIKLHGVEK